MFIVIEIKKYGFLLSCRFSPLWLKSTAATYKFQYCTTVALQGTVVIHCSSLQKPLLQGSILSLFLFLCIVMLQYLWKSKILELIWCFTLFWWAELFNTCFIFQFSWESISCSMGILCRSVILVLSTNTFYIFCEVWCMCHPGEKNMLMQICCILFKVSSIVVFTLV